MRYTVVTLVVVAITSLICWGGGHWRTVDAHPTIPGTSNPPHNPWGPHHKANITALTGKESGYLDGVRNHMCIPEQKYAGLSAAIHRLEEELRIVTNLTFINAGNHTIPTTTYEGFTQQLSLIKEILKTIDDDDGGRSNSRPVPNFRRINFTDLLPLLPKWEMDNVNVPNATANSSGNQASWPPGTSDYLQSYHHQQYVFLHMLIEFLLNLQENFENFMGYVEALNPSTPKTRQYSEPISDSKLELMELRFEHFASSILQKISELEDQLGSKVKSEERREASVGQGRREADDSRERAESVASPVWKDHSVQNSSMAGLEDKLDVLHEKFINFARDTEERLEALESKHGTTGTPVITASTCDGPQRHLAGTWCYAVPRILSPSVPGGGPATARLYTWWDARFLCKEVLGPSADLAVIRSKQQMEELTNILRNHFGAIEEFWLGASDLAVEGEWRWVDGQPLGPYTNWASPASMSPDQNCLSMLRGYKWSDEPCFYERSALCQLRLQ